jgi:hypothetical protein
MRFLRIRRDKRFRLFVASDAQSAPADRWFRSLNAALRAFNALDGAWKSDAWIIEYRDQPTIGGIGLVRNVVHVKHGERIEDASP